MCVEEGGEVLFRNASFRVVLVEDALFPGFCRVIWNAHAREMTDLTVQQREQCMRAVWLLEACVRDVMAPDKINVASLGNVVPHLHWHVIARYLDDAHFPNPIWGQPVREPDVTSLDARRAQLARLRAAIVQQFSQF